MGPDFCFFQLRAASLALQLSVAWDQHISDNEDYPSSCSSLSHQAVYSILILDLSFENNFHSVVWYKNLSLVHIKRKEKKITMAVAANGVKRAHQAEPVDISIVKKPANLGAVLPTLKYLNAGLPSLATDSDDARSDMLQAAWKLVMSLETPRETMIRHCWAQVTHNSSNLQVHDLRTITNMMNHSLVSLLR